MAQFQSKYTWSFTTLVILPTVTTGSATSVTTSSATLNGSANANGTSTTAWYQYGVSSGSYTGTSTTQTVTGTSTTSVGIGISGLSESKAYYCRIAAQNSAGASYGSETTFTTSSSPPLPYYITVSSASPSGNATGVAVNAAISATFSDTMSGSTFTAYSVAPAFMAGNGRECTHSGG